MKHPANDFVDLQYFVDTLPHITSRDSIAAQIENDGVGFTTDDVIRAWCEHDALHYLGNQPFTIQGEKRVAYLEQKFNKGWLQFGDKYNAHYKEPCECDRITPELIDETAQMIREFIY
jgi:hypothetical protein